MAAIDRKGIGAFLGLTFGLTFVYEGCLVRAGMSMDFGLTSAGPMPPAYAPLLIGLAMWIPALSTVIVVKFITKEGFGVTNIRIGALKPYALSALVIPAAFAVIYALTWLIGLSRMGIYLNEMTLRHRSSVLAGWMHGAFNGQFYGVWRLLFPNAHPLLGGVTGLVGMLVWAALGLVMARKTAVACVEGDRAANASQPIRSEINRRSTTAV